MRLTLSVGALILVLAVSCLSGAAFAQQYRAYETEPSAAWKAGDALFLRPLGVVNTSAGLAGFLGTLPLTIVTGTVPDAADAFVRQPARWTFQRQLGKPGPEPDFFLP